MVLMRITSLASLNPYFFFVSAMILAVAPFGTLLPLFLASSVSLASLVVASLVAWAICHFLSLIASLVVPFGCPAALLDDDDV